uniref:Uncharacterized protein n=1 Tax=Arundo donax TaxID=35708 RepID=A0A0A9AGR4_ARUDO
MSGVLPSGVSSSPDKCKMNPLQPPASTMSF